MQSGNTTRWTWVKPILIRKPVSETLSAPEAIIAQLLNSAVVQS